MGENLGQAVLELRADGSMFDRDMDRAEGRAEQGTSKMSGSFKKLGAAAKLGLAGIAAGVLVGAKKSIEAASNLEESVNAVNVVFGTASDKIHDFAKVAAKEAGLSARAFNELVTPVGASLQNVGFSADEAADASINLGKRAADMASVFGGDVSEALSAIQSGLRGEADPLERFGVGLSDAAVKAKAMEMGLAKSEKELGANAKAQARLALLMEQTNRVAGDFKETSGGLANSQKTAAGAIEDLQAKIGEKLLPVVARMSVALVDFIGWAERNWPVFRDAVKDAIEALEPVIDNIKARINAIVDTVRGVIKIIRGIKDGEWSTVWDGIKTVVVDGAFAMVKAMVELPAKIVLALAKKVWDGLSAVGGWIKDHVLSGIPGLLLSIALLPGKLLAALGRKVWEGLEAVGGWIVDAIVSGLRATAERIGDAVSAAVSSALGRINGIIDAVRTALSWLGKLGGGGPSEPVTAGKGGIPSGKAHGGPVRAGVPYMIGELGPELFVPRESGTIIPNGALTAGRGGGGAATVVHVHVAGSLWKTQDLVEELGYLLMRNHRAGGVGFSM